MQYLHIRNLNKYHPGYKDRTLQWAKIYFKMAQGDPDCEMIINEIDWGRLVKFILLELEAQKPIPLDNGYLTKKGLNLKIRPISLTLEVLHNFIEVVADKSKIRVLEVDKEVDKDKNSKCVTEFFNYFLLKTKKSLKLTSERKVIIEHRLKEGRTLEQLKQAVDNFILDDWQDRHKFIDIVYCIGIRNKVDNLDKWLNNKPKKKEIKIERPEPINEEEHKKVSKLIHETTEKFKGGEKCISKEI